MSDKPLQELKSESVSEQTSEQFVSEVSPLKTQKKPTGKLSSSKAMSIMNRTFGN